MNLRGLLELYIFHKCKEYRSKTKVTCIEKTNTDITCNCCHAKYDNSKCKTTDLLQAKTVLMTCIIEVD